MSPFYDIYAPKNNRLNVWEENDFKKLYLKALFPIQSIFAKNISMELSSIMSSLVLLNVPCCHNTYNYSKTKG